MPEAKLMIVDDAPFLRNILRRLASQTNWKHIVEACNGAEAVVVFEQERPNVVLLDIQMPNGDGLAVLKSIRAVDTECHVAMLSGDDHKDRIQEALALGASEFIPKPFEHLKMLSFLAHWKNNTQSDESLTTDSRPEGSKTGE